MSRFGEELGAGQRTSGGGGDGGSDSGGGDDSDGGSDLTSPDPDPAPSPGGSSPPPSDVGGPSGGSPEPDGPSGGVDLGGVSGSQGPSDAPGAGGDSDGGGGRFGDDSTGGRGGDSSDNSSGPQFGPGPNTDGGLGDADPGGDGRDVAEGLAADAATEINEAEANEEIVDRATTGGLLSERGGSAGLFPDQLGDGRVDISETRLRETAETASAAGQNLDLGSVTSAQAAVVSPFVGGQGVEPDARDLDPTTDAAPGSESIPEEAIEGAAAVPLDFPGAAAEAETGAEAGQSLLVDDQLEDFGAREVAETATAQGRDRAAQTGAAIQQNPAGFAGAVGAGALLGGAGAAAGSSTLRAGLRAEVDPRIGPFGTTIETRAGRGVRDFLDDDRGQAQLLPESRERDRGTDDDAGTVSDDDLGPDLDPFDRSDTRLFDQQREFGDDIGGMADDGPTVDPTSAESRQDIGGGIGGRGEAGIVGSDADSFSERGFGDVSGTELDPTPTDTLRDDLSPAGSGAGGLFGAPATDPSTGARAGGLLGTPGGFDATGTTGEINADTFGGVDLEIGFAPGGDTEADQPGDIDQFDPPTDTGTDQPGDIDQFDPPTADTPTTDTPSDQPTDQPSDQPTDRPSDLDIPLAFGAPEDDRRRDSGGLDDTSVANPVRSLAEADDRLIESFDADGGQDAP